MKLVSWNLGFAAGRWRDDRALHDLAWRWLAEVDPEIAFLQEVSPPPWARERWQVHALPHSFWASAIVVRDGIPFRAVTLGSDDPVGRQGSYHALGAVDLSDGTDLLVASIHTPAREAPRWATRDEDRAVIARSSVGVPWWNDVTFAGLRPLVSGHRFLVGGDWNTSRYLDADGVPSPPGAEFFERAAAAGWVELSLDDEGREGKSWYGSTNPRPHQPDHVFADPETAARRTAFRIEGDVAGVAGLSDHAPLIVELDLDV